jgi:hypothetical protein
MLSRVLQTGAFLLSLALLCFIAGAMVVLSEVFPYPWLRDAYIGGKAALEKQEQSADRYQTDFWYPERTGAKSVTVHDEARAQPGLTLYVSGHDTAAFLVSMAGEVVHEWHLPFSAVWDDSAAVRDPQPDGFMCWRKVLLFPNGDLLAIYVAAGDSPWGYGIVKLDKDSNVIWKYLQQTHHDVDIAEDGRIYALTHEIRFNTYPEFGQLQVPRIDDFVVVLSPDGEQEKKVPVIDALIGSPYSRLLSRLAWYTKGDYIHTNAIELIEGAGAERLRVGRPGQVLISLRELDMIALLDLESEEIVWALRGSWLAQHDPDLLPNGDILLFDNRGHYGEGGQSRIIEIDPVNAAIVWSYAGTAEKPFDSEVRGAQERLANGNTLISESLGGRILEVTPEGGIVWEFINPVRAEGRRADDGRPLIPIVDWAQRIDPDTLDPDFLGAELAGAAGAPRD